MPCKERKGVSHGWLDGLAVPPMAFIARVSERNTAPGTSPALPPKHIFGAGQPEPTPRHRPFMHIADSEGGEVLQRQGRRRQRSAACEGGAPGGLWSGRQVGARGSGQRRCGGEACR
eukprot:364453-Chlamydomonas_euryale.AAC.9